MSEQTAVEVLDLDSADLTWGTYTIAGSDDPADLVMLHLDAETQTRSVVVRFPAGWRRDATGNQPAAEEMVLLSGELAISGESVTPGHLLVVEPRATRSATRALGDALALVWFSGPGGGWVDGEAPDAGTLRVLPLAEGELRAPRPGLAGSVQVRADVSGERFDAPADVLWPEARAWVHLPAGTPAPQVAGTAVVRVWG